VAIINIASAGHVLVFVSGVVFVFIILASVGHIWVWFIIYEVFVSIVIILYN
jgi:hypothetical protein